jgi:excisionase family DNA binding protein
MAQVKVPATKTITAPVETFTSEEVAAILKTSPRTVQRLIQSGRLRAFRLGWAYRVNAEDLLAFCRTADAPDA